jgi:hypothetical protein
MQCRKVKQFLNFLEVFLKRLANFGVARGESESTEAYRIVVNLLHEFARSLGIPEEARWWTRGGMAGYED